MAARKKASGDESVELAVAELLAAVDLVRTHFPTLTRENAASGNGQAIVRMFEARAHVGAIMSRAD